MESFSGSKIPIEWERIDDKLHRLKVGEIFQFSDNTMSMTCINCSQEFQYFTEFSLHIQEHYVHGDIAPLNEKTEEKVVDLPNLENEAADTDLKAAALKISDDDDDGDNVGDTKDHSEALLPEPNCEVSENEDFDEFGLDTGGWSDDDFNENSHSIFGCEPKIDKKQQEDGEEEEEQQQQQIQFFDGTDYEKCRDKFKCLTCDHESDKWKQFKVHLIAHMSPLQVKCPLCSKVFSSVAYVRTHCSQAHSVRVSASKIKETQSSSNPVDITALERPKEVKIVYSEGIDYKKVDQKFQCITCRRVMAKFDHMKEHLLIHNSEKNVYCPICNKAFITESYVRKHVNRTHKKRITAEEIRAAQPTDDSKPVKVEIALTTTEEAERQQQQQKVGEAGKSFVEGEDYEKSNGRFKCLMCGRKILDHIKEHLLTHSNEKNVYCPFCDKAFISVSYVRKHVNRAHKKKITAEEIRNVQANIDASNKNDNSKDDLHTHKKTTKTALVPTMIKKNFECFECHRPFTGLRTLRTHMPLHSGIKYPCQYCGKQFVKQSYVRDHIAVMHKPTKTTKCKVHSNRQPNVNASFQCNQCHMTFDTKQTLRQHTKTHTKGPFLCVTCGAVYKFKVNLKCHMEIHQAGPNNRQKCLDPSCQKTFPIRRYMLNHYRSIHLKQGKQKKSKSNEIKIEIPIDSLDDGDEMLFE